MLGIWFFVMKNSAKIKSYTDLEVYQRTYKLPIVICTKVVIKLPVEEKFDLADQLRRSSKAVPRLIAEVFAKKHQKKGYQKYLDDAMSENNETIVSLCHVRDIYLEKLNPNSIQKLIEEYEIAGKQLYRLKQSWNKFCQ